MPAVQLKLHITTIIHKHRIMQKVKINHKATKLLMISLLHNNNFHIHSFNKIYMLSGNNKVTNLSIYANQAKYNKKYHTDLYRIYNNSSKTTHISPTQII